MPGASYGFIKNSSTGYYISQNKGYSSSYALCKVILKAPVAMKVDFNCINYAEANYDYGILSNLNTTLGLSSSADSSSSIYKSFKGSSMSTVQTVTYDVPAGEHFIYVKFIKDGSTNNNNDTLQFTVNQASSFDQAQSGTELIVAGFNTIKQINNQIEVK